jgi:two-component system chemotaxis sensor kinase CheA
MEGQAIELDKSLLEAIRDPLTHALRNAVDHGIESAAERAAQGKPAEGLVRLRACHRGGHVIVEDHDAGTKIDRIRARAVERSLIPAARAAQMCEREVLQLVFLFGFSTAAAVTSVSGRGVDMDVVRTNVEKIGGKVAWTPTRKPSSPPKPSGTALSTDRAPLRFIYPHIQA